MYNSSIKAFNLDQCKVSTSHVPLVSAPTLLKKQTSTKFSSQKGILLNNVLVKTQAHCGFTSRAGLHSISVTTGISIPLSPMLCLFFLLTVKTQYEQNKTNTTSLTTGWICL